MYKYLILSILFFSVAGVADVSKKQQAEVAHLLKFIKSSDCKLVRNGETYTAAVAVKHMQKKYNYYRDDINSTEAFIKYSATKSTLSGSYYTVTCSDNKKIKTESWLLEELKRYRENTELLVKTSIKKEAVICKDPRPQICTMQYIPVCAQLKDGSVKTYASGCSACADPEVRSYKKESCK